MQSPIIYTDNGIIRFYDGTLIYIEEVLYSPDGLAYWEKVFNPNPHIYTEDGITNIGGHLYRKVKHAGDTVYQLPYKFVGEDGDYTEFRVHNNFIQTKLSKEEIWVDLISLDTLKGEKGDTGETGEGIQVTAYKAFDKFGHCSSNSVHTGCNSCNSTHVSTDLIVSLGNHQLDNSDLTTFYRVGAASAWTECTVDQLGLFVHSWLASDIAGTNAVSCNAQGDVIDATNSNIIDSKGLGFICVNNYWTQFLNVIQPLGLVKSNVSDTLGYLNDKIDNVTIEVNIDNNLQVKDLSIITDKIADAAVTADKIDLITLAGEGLNDTNGILNVNVDDSSLEILTDVLKVKNEGIKGTHISTTTDPVFDSARGFDLGDIDTTGVKVKVNTTEGIDVDSNGVKLLLDGTQGKHLNPNVANDFKGIQLLNDKLEVKVDDDTIKIDGAGKLYADLLKGDLIAGTGILLTGNLVEVLNENNVTIEVDPTTILHDDLVNVANSVAHTKFPLLDGSRDLTGVYTYSTEVPIVDRKDLAHKQYVDDAIDNAIGGGSTIDHNSTLNKDVDSAHPQYILKSVAPAQGDMIIGTASGLTKLAIGADNTVLTSNGVTAVWETLASPTTAGNVSTLSGSKANGVSNEYSRADHQHDFADDSIGIPKVDGLIEALASALHKTTVNGVVQTYLEFGNIRLVIDSNTNNGLYIKENGGEDWFKLNVIDGFGSLDTAKYNTPPQ